MIRIFPDFSVQVTASAAGAAGVGGGGGGAGGGMVAGPPVGRVPVPGATNGTPQSLQGIGAYQQRYVKTTCSFGCQTVPPWRKRFSWASLTQSFF